MENRILDQEMTLRDRAERSLALDLSRSFVVQAPAGSGKTELLIQRYLALLGEAVNSPEEVLAITFTRKAAQEMKNRVIGALEAAQSKMPEEEHRQKTWYLARAVLQQSTLKEWQLLENSHRLRILTIDSLCAWLAKQAPFKSWLPEHIELLENDDELYVKAVRALFDHVEEESEWSKSLEKLLLHLDNNPNLAENLLVNLLKKREQWLTHLNLGQVEPGQLREQLEAGLAHTVTETLSQLPSLISQEDQQELAFLAMFAAGNLSSEHPVFVCGQYGELAPATAEHYAYWEGISQLILTQTGTVRKSLDVRIGFPTSKIAKEKALLQTFKNRMLVLLEKFSMQEVLVKQLQLVRCLPSLSYQLSQWEILKAILQVLPVLLAHLQLLFQKYRKVDHVEMMLKALNALGHEGEPTELVLNLDYKIRHILVDEFQDTSFTQFHLLEKLTSGWQIEEGRTLFLVGDPMQSIYRFRKAEVGLFLRAQRQGLSEIKPQSLVLKTNFRSKPTIVNWVNTIFKAAFPAESDMITGAVHYSPSLAMQEDFALSKIYYSYGEDEAGCDEALGIKQFIMQERQDDPLKSIAILVRSRGHLREIIKELKEAGIPFNATEIKTLVQSGLIQDLLALTRSLCYLTDRCAWLAILRSPWCGIDLKDLTTIAQAHEVVWEAINIASDLPISSFAKERLSYFVAILKKIMESRQRMGLSKWIQDAWLLLSGDQCVLNEDHREQVTLFFDFLAEIDEGGDILDRILFEKKLSTCFIDESSTEVSPVEIMTIHKAKGLEFDTVILPKLHASTQVDSHELLLWMERPRLLGGEDLLIAPLKAVEDEEHDPIYAYLRYIESEKAKQESIRLFYVAATRAKSKLYLSWTTSESIETYVPARASFLNLCWPYIKGMEIERLISANQEEQHQKHRRYILPQSLMKIDDKKVLKADKIVTELEENSLLRERGLRNAGILLHRVLIQRCLSSVALSGRYIEEQIPCWKTILKGLGTPSSLLDSGIELTKSVLSNVMKDKEAQWLFSAHIDSKVNYPVTLCKGNRVEQVMIDRLFVDEFGRRWLVMFKMDEINQNPESHFRSLLDCANVLFDCSAQAIAVGVYYPLQSLFFKKVINKWE